MAPPTRHRRAWPRRIASGQTGSSRRHVSSLRNRHGLARPGPTRPRPDKEHNQVQTLVIPFIPGRNFPPGRLHRKRMLNHRQKRRGQIPLAITRVLYSLTFQK